MWVDYNVYLVKDEVGFRDVDVVVEVVEVSVCDVLLIVDFWWSGEVVMDFDSLFVFVEVVLVFDDFCVIGCFCGLYLFCEVDDEFFVVD